MIGVYEEWRDEFAKILDERFYTISWLDCQVTNGAVGCMGNESAAILYEIETYPTGWRELKGMAAAGDLAIIKEVLIPAAESLAKTMGCGSAEIASREGWARVLPDYEMHQVTIKKVF